jgi:cobalt/nickel transport system permease protein
MFAQRGRFIERSLRAVLSFINDAVLAETHAGRPGFLQARDPRVKIAASLILLVVAATTRSFAVLAALYLIIALLVLCSRIELGFFFARTWVFVPIFALAMALPALFSFFSPGDVVGHVRIFALSLSVTRQGILGAGLFVSRVAVCVSVAVLLALTTRHSALLRALRCLGIPQIYVMTMGMTYRYIHLFVEIVGDTFTAIRSRVGYAVAVPSGRRIVAWNIASLWRRSFDLHLQVHRAMIARGYRGEAVATQLFKTTRKDWAWLLAVAAAGYLLWTL